MGEFGGDIQTDKQKEKHRHNNIFTGPGLGTRPNDN